MRKARSGSRRRVALVLCSAVLWGPRPAHRTAAVALVAAVGTSGEIAAGQQRHDAEPVPPERLTSLRHWLAIQRGGLSRSSLLGFCRLARRLTQFGLEPPRPRPPPAGDRITGPLSPPVLVLSVSFTGHAAVDARREA
jgi:hypothetical protein